MTDTCTCPPDDCHGGHTINVGMPTTPPPLTTCDHEPCGSILLGVPILDRTSAHHDRAAVAGWHLATEQWPTDRCPDHWSEVEVEVIGTPCLTDEQLRRIAAGQDWLSQSERSSRARVAELEDEGADAVADGFGIQGMTIGPNGTDLNMTPTTEDSRRLVLAMAMACGKMLADADAPNYVEFEAGPAGQPGYVVHVRRASGPSPHTLRRDAEARADRAEARVAELEAAQREPIAYTVVHRLPGDDVAFLSRYYLDRDAAEQRAADEGPAYRVVELREVTR